MRRRYVPTEGPAGWLYQAAILKERYERKHNSADLAEVIRLYRKVLAQTSSRDPDFAGSHANLAAALAMDCDETRNEGQLIEAAQLARRAVELSNDRHPDRYLFLRNLGNILRTFIDFGVGPEVLRESVAFSRAALALLPESHPEYGKTAGYLGQSLVVWFDLTQDSSALEESLEHHRTAAARSRSPLDRADALDASGQALQLQALRSKESEVLDEAIRFYREALELTPRRDHLRATVLSHLGAALLARAQRTGEAADLDEAIRIGTAAVKATPPEDSSLAMAVSNLGSAYQERFTVRREPTDSDTAVGLGRKAVELAQPGSRARMVALINLGMTLTGRVMEPEAAAKGATFTGGPRSEDLALQAFREAAAMETAGPLQRILAYWSWGQGHVVDQHWNLALDAYALGIELLPRVAPTDLRRTDREYTLSELSGFAVEGAMCALEVGELEAAVQFLEAGRGVLFASAITEHTSPRLAAADAGMQ